MLRKCLKYNFRATGKMWIIASVIASAAIILAGFAVKTLMTVKWSPSNASTGIILLSIFTLVGAIIAASAYVVIGNILGPFRMYKSCFTDEGYFTFTLPVKRSTIFNASLLHGASTSFCTNAVMFIDIMIFLLIIPGEKTNTTGMQDLFGELDMFLTDIPAGGIVLIVLALILALSYWLFSQALIYASIVVGGVIVKKARLLMSVGVYVIANATLTTLYYLLITVLSITVLSGNVTFGDLAADSAFSIVNLLLAGVICFFAVITAAAYSFSVDRLRNGLNLS